MNPQPVSRAQLANLILNLVSGFFRVNYSPEVWESIISHLESYKFRDVSSASRAALIDDALSLARLGRLDYSIALKILKLLAQETDFAPLSAAKQSLEFLESILSETQAEQYYKVSWIRLNLINGMRCNIFMRLNFESMRKVCGTVCHFHCFDVSSWAENVASGNVNNVLPI